jgi:hypothetical protein
LVSLCDILGCTPNDLIQPEVVNVQVRKTVGAESGSEPIEPRRTVIRRPGRQ